VKIGVLSDIHGNLPALRSVLAKAEQENVERLFVLGDIVGYYYWPAECLSLLDQWQSDLVLGNHEVMLAEIANDVDAIQRITAKYGSALATAGREMHAGLVNRLVSLPANKSIALDGRSAFLCHGSPDDTNEYVYPDATQSKREQMNTGTSDVTFFGHTHYPVIWKLGDVFVANPGSVGQSRNYQPGAHWIMWDTERNQLTARRENYDAAPVIEECKFRDPELPYLHQILVRDGRPSQ